MGFRFDRSSSFLRISSIFNNLRECGQYEKAFESMRLQAPIGQQMRIRKKHPLYEERQKPCV
jgi:hypothetical protein